MKRLVVSSRSFVFIGVLLATMFLSLISNAQQNFFQDKPMVEELKKSFLQLYNFQFREAGNTVLPVRNKYKDYPPLQIFDCLNIYWMNFPVSTHEKEYEVYKKRLTDALDHAESILKNDKGNPEKIFYCLLLNIMLSRQNFEDGNTWKAVRHSLNAYEYIKKGFKLQPTFSEFYFSTGMYNYYREFFADQNPGYKPFLIFFPSGSREKGLKELDIASRTTVFVMPEALMFSSYINLRYEDNPAQGLQYAKRLHDLYPNNLFFTVLYVENLVQSNLFEQAIPYINQLNVANNDYYRLPLALFKGMLEEKHYKRSGEAKKLYLSAINLDKKVVKANENYIGLAYFGLGNIEKADGNEEIARKYFKKACGYCTYKKVKKLACD